MIRGLKICGISDHETLNYIINHPYPPKYIGFITNYEKSKRNVKYEVLKKITDINKKEIKFVSVLVNPSDEILDKIKKSPADLDAKMNYSKILLQENNFSECIDVLLEIFKEDREWKEGLAKKQLLSIFEHLGSDDELSKKGRRSLTSLIFV